MRRIHQGLFAITISGLAASAAIAQNTPANPAGSTAPTIYISDFKAIYQNPNASGHLHHIRTTIRQNRAYGAASTLAQDMVKALNARGAKACYLSADDPKPVSGWLVSGVFYATDTKGPLASLLTGPSKTPNTEVTVSVTDLASTAPQPFATIGSNYALKGQGSLFSTNPYEVAAKFVVHKIEAGKSIHSLSDEIVAKILVSQTTLEAHDAGV